MSEAVSADMPDEPRSLADPARLDRRRALLPQPHMRPLLALVESIRAKHGMSPDPDPLDGGVDARLLLLLETPGPGSGRTGFVSRDNPNGTAANLFRFLAAAKIAREDTLIWNAVPWVIHAPGATNRAPRTAEATAGRRWLASLLVLLPRLTVIVLAGRVAGTARGELAVLLPRVPSLGMPHPSPTYVCTSPTVAVRISSALDQAGATLAAHAPTIGDPLKPAADSVRAGDAHRSSAPFPRRSA